MELTGRVALVTGAVRGIGRMYTEELLNHGAKVSMCDINTTDGAKLAQTLAAKHGKDRVVFCNCDVTDYLQLEASFQTTISVFGSIDIVINNAGIMHDRLWELEVDINLNGVIRGMLLAQRFLGVDRGGKGGIVINIGSNVAITPYASLPIYSATKSAVVGLTRAFGDEYHVGITGIKVMALCPSVTCSKGNVAPKSLLSSSCTEAWHRDTASYVPQKPEQVGKALIHVLLNGQSGSVWLAENSSQPREVVFPE